MKLWKLATALAAAMACTACTSDKVVFVTTTSFGINMDTTPGTVSLAYDRTEGYAAPSYRSGTLPPVLASIETDGTAISPRIRQVYATGVAAVIAGGGRDVTEPHTMTHRNGRTTFVGTTTTLGLKVAFTTGAPESFNLGFKRKEFSYIPLGCQSAVAGTCDAEAEDLYPSVIASYDTTIDVPNPPGTSLKTRQFVATGLAAEALAPSVVPEFRALAKESVAFQAGHSEAAFHQKRVDSVLSYVAPGGAFDAAKLKALVETANAAKPGSVSTVIASAASADQLRAVIGADDDAGKRLAAAIPQGPVN